MEERGRQNDAVVLRLLVIEDDEFFVELLDAFLEFKLGRPYTLAHTFKLQEGLELLSNNSFDMLLLDLSLPDSYGLDTLEQACRIAGKIPIIVLTGNEDEEQALTALRMGAHDYLVKSNLRDVDLIRAIRYANERVVLSQQLGAREAHFQGIFDKAPVGIAHISFDWDFVLVNEACCQILGYTRQELLQKSLTELNPFALDLYTDSQQLLAGDLEQLTLEDLYINPNNDMQWLNINISVMQPQYGTPGYFIVILEDITTQKQAEIALRQNALYDPLTGLPNRALLRDRLRQALARYRRHHNYAFAVLFLDLDRFKTINDSLGHITGDTLLIEVARRLTSALRGEDTVARWGGDEFVLLLDSLSQINDATDVAERLLQLFAEPFVLEERELFVSTSIGILPVSGKYQTTEELLRDADIAMYHAKDTGRSRYAVFHENMRTKTQKLLQLDSAIRRAIEREELSVHYQPIVSLQTGKIVSFEALVRWNHPDRGMVSPADFLPLAEETGFICTIDRWVLMEATRQLKQWQQQYDDPTLSISINLSSLHFAQDDIIQDVEGCLKEVEISAESLHLEITESAIIKNQNLATPLLQQLKALGTKIYMDDFGTGYSSLSYIQSFPLDVLKVDRSFIRKLGENPKQERIIELITALAQTIGLKVVAEGIETEAQHHFLRQLGCEFGQGYLYSRPLPADDASAQLKESPYNID